MHDSQVDFAYNLIVNGCYFVSSYLRSTVLVILHLIEALLGVCSSVLESVSVRRADERGHRVLVLELAHVDADKL